MNKTKLLSAGLVLVLTVTLPWLPFLVNSAVAVTALNPTIAVAGNNTPGTVLSISGQVLPRMKPWHSACAGK